MNNFYVYIHRKESDNSIYYVGKGKGNRAFVTSGRNNYWQKTFVKHGMIVEIIQNGLTEKEAFDLEVKTIADLKKSGVNLCNLTDGGEGLSGFKLTDDRKQFLSNLHKGRIKSDKTRLLLSLSMKGKKRSKESIEKNKLSHIGLKATDETKLKMSETRKRLQVNADINIYVFFSKEDVFIGTRNEFHLYSGIPKHDFRTLFGKQSYKVVKGWSVLKFNELLILKEIQNDYCY